jgi:hypothetical protein
MASKLLLRLIDEAIVPAFMLLGIKILAVLVIVYMYQIPWEFSPVSVFPTILFEDINATMFVSTYSTLAMYLFAILGLIWVLLRAYYLHDTHISPRTVLQLLSMNASWLISASHDLYHKGLVWLSYVWLITGLIGIHTILGLNALWLLVVGIIVSTLVTWLFIADVEREIRIAA